MGWPFDNQQAPQSIADTDFLHIETTFKILYANHARAILAPFSEFKSDRFLEKVIRKCIIDIVAPK